MAVPGPADCDGSHFVLLLEEILIHSAVFWNTTMDQDMFELFSKVNFDQNLQQNLVKKEMKIATSHQKLHAGTYYIHMYIVRKYLNKKMALFKICQWPQRANLSLPPLLFQILNVRAIKISQN